MNRPSLPLIMLLSRHTRRRAAIEPVIGHLKDDHLMGRNHLKGREGDRINAVLASAGYNFRLSCASSSAARAGRAPYNSRPGGQLPRSRQHLCSYLRPRLERPSAGGPFPAGSRTGPRGVPPLRRQARGSIFRRLL